jgi:hypothetical protein
MSIEDRLVRDIAAVTGGVVVTESDLKEARIALAERMDNESRHVRLRRLAPAAAAVVALGVAGGTAYMTLGGDDDAASQPANPPAESDPDADYLIGNAPTAQILNGVWRLDNGHVTVKFREDGGVRFDDQGTLFSHPSVAGTYAIAGQRITVTVTDNTKTNCVGTTFAIRASLVEAGELRYVPDSAVGDCFPLPPGRGAWEQVLPTNNKNLAALVFSTDKGWRALASKAEIYGVWLAEGGRFLLEMDRGGTYFVADVSGEPVDSGQWSLRGTDLTLTSSAGSARCTSGDKLVLGAVQWENPGTPALRGTLRQNTCDGAWTPPAWIQLPNLGG